MLTNYVSPEQRFVTCTNQDVTYGYGFLDNLDREPIVFQVPDFGDRFYVYALYDARTDEISNISKQYGTKLGFYMVVGPNWKGLTPQGITAVLRSSTEVVATAPRVFIDDTPEDHAAVQPILSQIDFYSISKFDGKMKTVDQTRSMLETPQRYPRAGSQSYPTPAAAANLDGSTTVYFGPTKPTGVGDGNWIQTVPGKRWNTLLRFYSPLEPFFTKAWRPGEIEPQS